MLASKLGEQKRCSPVAASKHCKFHYRNNAVVLLTPIERMFSLFRSGWLFTNPPAP